MSGKEARKKNRQIRWDILHEINICEASRQRRRLIAPWHQRATTLPSNVQSVLYALTLCVKCACRENCRFISRKGRWVGGNNNRRHETKLVCVLDHIYIYILPPAHWFPCCPLYSLISSFFVFIFSLSQSTDCLSYISSYISLPETFRWFL